MIKAIVCQTELVGQIIFSYHKEPFVTEIESIKDLARILYQKYKEESPRNKKNCCKDSQEKDSKASFCSICGNKLEEYDYNIDFFYFSEWFLDLIFRNASWLNSYLGNESGWKVNCSVDFLRTCKVGEILLLNENVASYLVLAMEELLTPQEKQEWDFWYEEQKLWPLDMLQGI